MKILFANCHRAIVGGAERYIASAMAETLRRGHEIGLLYSFAHRQNGAAVDDHAPGTRMWCLESAEHEQTLREIAAWRPDVVYGHGLEPVEVEQSLVDNYPFVVFIHNYSHTCPSGRKCQVRPSFQICSRKAGPVCLLLHYPRGCGGIHPLRTWRDYRLQSQRQAMLPRYKFILVASTHMRNELLAHGADGGKLHRTKLPPTDFSPDPDPPVWREITGQLLMTGRLTELKGGDLAIEAVELASKLLKFPLQLTIAGDGPQGDALRRQVSGAAIDARVAGWLGSAELLDLMRHADLMLVPSIWPEPFGLVGIEAGCFGLPSVAFASGGITDWLTPGYSGECAEADPPTASGLADAIVRALRDTGHFNSLRRGAWEVARTYSMADHMRDLENAFRIATQNSLAASEKP